MKRSAPVRPSRTAPAIATFQNSVRLLGRIGPKNTASGNIPPSSAHDTTIKFFLWLPPAPKLHIHLLPHLVGPSQVVSTLPTSALGEEDSEAQMTQDFQRSHLELARQGESVSIQRLRRLPTPGTVSSSDHVTQKTQDHGFVAKLPAIPCALQRVLGPPTRLVDLSDPQVTFRLISHELRATRRDTHEPGPSHRSIEEGKPFGRLLGPNEGQSEACADGRKKNADVVVFSECEGPPELPNGAREVPFAQIRAPETKTGSGHVERIPELLGAREAALTKCQGFGKLPNFGETPCEQGTGESMAGVPMGSTIPGDPVLEKVD